MAMTAVADKEVISDGKDEELQWDKENVFEEEIAPMFNAWTPDHYQQKSWGNRLAYINAA